MTFSFVRTFTLVFISIFLVACQVTYTRPPFSVTMNKPVSKPIPKPMIQQEVELEGFWVSSQTGQVVEVLADGRVILNRFGVSQPMSFEEHEVTKTLDNNSNLIIVFADNTISFQKPAHTSIEELSGKWFYYTSEDGYERSKILNYEADGYLLESVELFHIGQGFSRYSQFYSYEFSQGFVFEEFFEGNESYWYYLIDVSENSMTFVDEDGTKWTENRYVDQQILTVPNHYSDESF